MTLIKERIDVPKRIHKGDFVLRLTKGVERAQKTLRHYVVTPQKLSCKSYKNHSLTIVN